MTIQIELDHDTELQLLAKARANGMEPSGFASQLLRSAIASSAAIDSAQAASRHSLDAMAAHAPAPPAFDDQNWSRAIIYGEHN